VKFNRHVFKSIVHLELPIIQVTDMPKSIVHLELFQPITCLSL